MHPCRDETNVSSCNFQFQAFKNQREKTTNCGTLCLLLFYEGMQQTQEGTLATEAKQKSFKASLKMEGIRIALFVFLFWGWCQYFHSDQQKGDFTRQQIPACQVPGFTAKIFLPCLLSATFWRNFTFPLLFVPCAQSSCVGLEARRRSSGRKSQKKTNLALETVFVSEWRTSIYQRCSCPYQLLSDVSFTNNTRPLLSPFLSDQNLCKSICLGLYG